MAGWTWLDLSYKSTQGCRSLKKEQRSHLRERWFSPQAHHFLILRLNGMVSTSALRWRECQAYFFSHRRYGYIQGPGEEGESHPLGGFEPFGMRRWKGIWWLWFIIAMPPPTWVAKLSISRVPPTIQGCVVSIWCHPKWIWTANSAVFPTTIGW